MLMNSTELAQKIINVQPLQGPVGLVYYLNYRYSSCKGQRPMLESLMEDWENHVCNLDKK